MRSSNPEFKLNAAGSNFGLQCDTGRMVWRKPSPAWLRRLVAVQPSLSRWLASNPRLLLAAFRRVSELDAEWIEAFLSLSLRGLEEGAEPFSAQNPQN